MSEDAQERHEQLCCQLQSVRDENLELKHRIATLERERNEAVEEMNSRDCMWTKENARLSRDLTLMESAAKKLACALGEAFIPVKCLVISDGMQPYKELGSHIREAFHSALWSAADALAEYNSLTPNTPCTESSKDQN